MTTIELDVIDDPEVDDDDDPRDGPRLLGPIRAAEPEPPAPVPHAAPRRLPLAPGERPRTRGDCVDGPRPCPWSSCQYHLMPIVSRGRLAGAGIEQLVQTCTLDVAAVGATIAEVSEILGISRQRVQQIEAGATRRLRRRLASLGVEAP